MDGPGALDPGSHEYKFSFKNVDLDVDSYNGISIDVEYQVWAEMKVQGQLMVYSVKTKSNFEVKNVRQDDQICSNLESSKIEDPRLRFTYSGFRDLPRPTAFEFYLHKTHLNIERDFISGYILLK